MSEEPLEDFVERMAKKGRRRVSARAIVFTIGGTRRSSTVSCGYSAT